MNKSQPQSKSILMIALKLDVGGLERLLIELMLELSARGYHVVLCTLQEPGTLAGELDDSDVKVIPLYKPEGISFKATLGILKIIKDENIDLIHTHNAAAHFYGAQAAFLSRTPLINTKHGQDAFNPRGYFRNFLCHLVSKYVVAVSNETRKMCTDLERCPEKKLKVIINGVNVDPYIKAAEDFEKRQNQDPNKPLVIGHVGRLSDVKNQGMMIRVFNQFKDSFPNSKLELVGDGPNRAQLEALTQELGLEEQVIFLGYRSDIPDLVAQFDWFCLSSLSEGLPLVIIEAMAAKCPIVSTNVGGLAEIVKHGINGYLVPSQDEEAMLNRWLELAQSSENRTNFGAMGQQLATKEFGLSKMVDQYEELY